MRMNAAARLRTLAPAPLWSASARAVPYTSRCLCAASRLYSSQPDSPRSSGDPAQKRTASEPASSSPPGGAPNPNKHEDGGQYPGPVNPIYYRPRSRIMTWIKTKLLLLWLERAVSDFKRDEFLEGAVMAFRALMEKFPPDNPERFKDALSPPLYDAILSVAQESPLRSTSELQDLLNYWIKDVDIVLPVEGEHSLRQLFMSGEPPTLPIPVQITVRFNIIEKLTTKVEVKDKPPQIISDNLTVQRHEWLFGGNLNTKESPNWMLLSV